MANTEVRLWNTALDRVLEENEDTDRPSTLYGLAVALAAHPESNQTETSWKTTIRRIRKDDRLAETTAMMIADVLGVPRTDLPPSSTRPTLRDVEGRLRRVEAGKADADDVKGTLQVFEAAIRALANGDTDAALRMLSETQ